MLRCNLHKEKQHERNLNQLAGSYKWKYGNYCKLPIEYKGDSDTRAKVEEANSLAEMILSKADKSEGQSEIATSGTLSFLSDKNAGEIIEEGEKQCNSCIEKWAKEVRKKPIFSRFETVAFVVVLIVFLVLVYIAFIALSTYTSSGETGPDISIVTQGKEPVECSATFHGKGILETIVSSLWNLITAFIAAIAAFFKFSEELLVLKKDRLDSDQANLLSQSNDYIKRINWYKLATGFMIVASFAAAVLPIRS